MTETEIIAALLDYVVHANPTVGARESIPLDQSLFTLGILDSFGVIEMVGFVETKWGIKIFDAEITDETFGGINKMAKLISKKLGSDGQ